MTALRRALASTAPASRAAAVAWRLGLLPVPRRTVTVRLADGRRLTCDLRDATHRNMWLERFEPRESAVVRGLRPGAVFVDVGAHIGWFTTLAARAAGPTGRVLAIEPFPPSRRMLERNVSLNGPAAVTIRAEAIGAAPGSATLGAQRGSDTGSVTAGPRAHHDVHVVTRATLDTLVEEEGIAEVDLLKVDVEGLEMEVLEGAPATLLRTSAVLIELNRSALTSNGTSPELLADRLRAAGFIRHTLLGQQATARGLPAFTNLLAERPER